MKINVVKPSLPPFNEYCDLIKSVWETFVLTNNGPLHNELVYKLKNYLHVPYLTLFTNGHSALESAIEVCNFPAGSEIITTPFTFASTTNAIIRKGFKPVFCDIDRSTLTLDTKLIESLITEKTVAILGVHVFGMPCAVNEIEKIAKKFKLKVIYDAAHAFGVFYHGKSILSYGDLSILSFHATKVFNSIEGGAVCHNKSKYHKTLELIKSFGIEQEECFYPGCNFKMNEFQAAMGLCNLNHIDEYILKRKKLYERYYFNLKNKKGINLISIPKGIVTNYSYMPVIFDGYKFDRNEVKRKLEENGIGSRKYFYPSTNDFSFIAKKQSTPNAKFVSEHILVLPLYDSLSLEDVDLICKIILN